MSRRSPGQLLDAAEDLLSRPAHGRRGLWTRAAAVLTRQALEARIAELHPQLRGVSGHHQMLALRELLDDTDLAAELAWAWASLSRAVHHHIVDVAPTDAEVRHLMKAVRRFIADDDPRLAPTAAGLARRGRRG